MEEERRASPSQGAGSDLVPGASDLSRCIELARGAVHRRASAALNNGRRSNEYTNQLGKDVLHFLFQMSICRGNFVHFNDQLPLDFLNILGWYTREQLAAMPQRGQESEAYLNKYLYSEWVSSSVYICF